MHTMFQTIVFKRLFPYIDLWYPKSKSFILSPCLNFCQVWWRCMQLFSLYHLYRVIFIYIICNLDWPLISKINRGHPLTMVKMSVKFDKDAYNVSVSIMFNRSFHKCPCDLWPLNSKNNRVHLVIMVNMSAKFGKEAHNGLVSLQEPLTRFKQ